MVEPAKTGKVSGLVKAGVTSVLGLFGGAVLMYVSPLLNSAIKPPKPLANFAHQAQGLTVTFQNRSSGGGDGWWDFGDGSALEPYIASQEALVHQYPRPGNYNIKLSLRNFLGEETERAVSVNLDGGSALAPAIETFQLISLKPDNTAPATFRIVSRIKNAELCIWSLGDDRPLDVSSDVSNTQDRLITLKEAGSYTIRLVAVSGNKTAEKAETVYVAMPDNNVALAALGVAYDAVKVDRKEKGINMGGRFPAKHPDNTFAFSDEQSADAGYHIVEARLAKTAKETVVKDVKLDVAPDKTRVRLTGTLVKASGLLNRNAAAPSWFTTVQLTMEKRAAAIPPPVDPVAQDLKLPGTTMLPIPTLPQGWLVQQRRMSLELRDGAKVVWRDAKLPSNALLQFKGRPYRVTAVEQGDQIRLEATLAQTAGGPPF